MKIIAKRSLSMLMALVLIVSLFSGVALPASAASYSYNWGTRGVTATYLSSAAQNFYSNTSYEELSSYTGSSNLSSVPSSALYIQLQSLMAGKQHTQTSYKGTRDLYKYTDCQNGGGRISSFYSGVEIGPDWDSGATWNREHTWPNSKGDASGNGENDIMMLRPASVSENSSRGNTAYGISGGYYDPNRESGYTLNLHGDVARIMLYVYVRWGNTGKMWGGSGVIESREVLLAWMEEDPVDTWELGRNDSVQSITGTRNVFVDYPELAFLMFGEEIPDTMPTPSGMAIAGAHDIQVSSNDTAMGTVSISGKNIQAYPAVGHKVVGYEVVSGTAEVTQNGNAFEVKASSDCEIKIIFAPKLFVEMTYRNNGQILSASQVYDGDPVTLAAYTETAPANFTFLGWVDAPVSATETVPTYYKVGASYTVSGTTNMHALFSWVLRDDEGSRTCYTTSTCIHENTVDVKEKDADCTNNGYTAGVYCNDCESYITGHEVIGSLGHNHIAVVTPPTVTDAGYTTHTCDRCGDVYTSDPVPALGETYTVSFSVPADAASVEDMGCNTTGILLPEADDVEGHTFLGWVTASMEDTTEKPAILKAGDKFVATANTTLYALYTYMEGNTVAGDYVLVTSAGQLEAGTNVIIVASDYNYALSTTQNSNNRGQVAITKNGDAVDATAGMAVLELRAGAVAGTYAFYCPVNGGYLYAAANTGNQLKTQFALDANGSFLLTFDGAGICTATAQGTNSRNTLRYNKSSMFACYAATYTNAADISLYMEAPAGIAHYTTNIVHRHSGTYHAAAEATCQSAGNVVYYSCGCGLNFADSDCTQVLSSILIPRLDHSFTAETVDAKYLKTEANCQTAAVYYLSCVSCGISSNSDNAVFVSGDVNPDNHPGEGIFTGETPATCTENGVRGDIVCGECGGVMEKGGTIPATGHGDAIAVSETVSTCSTHGLKFHFHCDACGGDYLEKGVAAEAQKLEDLQLPLNPQNHEETELRNASEATCEADGYTGDFHCSGCGEKLEEGKTIPGGHTVENGICTRCEAYGTCGENLTWTLTEDGILIISGTGVMYNYANFGFDTPWYPYVESVKTIVIENGVTSIGDCAFSDCKKLTAVEIPDSVTDIGEMAFRYCTSLTSVEIPDSVTSIGNAAFVFCYSLTSVTIPTSVIRMDENVFLVCDSLTKIVVDENNPNYSSDQYGVLFNKDQTALISCPAGKTGDYVIPDSVTSIGNTAFYNCGGLTSVKIPDSVTSIGDSAFERCFGLTNLVIPDSVIDVGNSAFWGCTSLTEITFEGDAPEFGEAVFDYVTATAYYPAGNATWTSDVMKNYGGTITWVARGSGTCGESLTWTYENGTLTISGVGEMYDYSTEANPENAPWAYHLEEVKSIVIEEGVTSVGHQAFSGLFAVTEISLPDTLTTIGGSAFFNCVALKEIVIPANVTAIGDSAFTFCYALKEITFEGSAPAIGNEAFGLVTANVHYTPDASWTVDVKQNYGGTLSWDSYVTYVAMIGSVGYATVAEALAAAQSGDQVQMLKDTFESNVVLPKGIALDLNGNVLEADYIFAVNGANIVDESESNTGLLKADADCVLISKANAQLPVWNGEGYVFTRVTYLKALVAHNADMVKFAFLPQFQSVATELLKDGFEGNKVTVEVRVSWETIQGREYRNLVFNNDQVGLGISSGGAFILTFSGFSQLNLTTDVAIEAVVYSETGVSVASEAVVVDVTEKPAPTDPLEIVKDAYALAGGEELPYNPVTLTGTISKVNYPWSDQYGNITVTIYIDEDVDKKYPIECFRMVSSGEEMDEAIKTLAVGDTVTVKGTLMKYQNATTGATKVEFNNPELIAFTDNTTEEPEEVLDTPEKIVNAAYALAEGESLEGTYSLTGKVLSVDTPYSSEHDNVTVTIQIGDMTDKPIKCYRMKGEGAAELKAGDIITVTGTLKNYYSTIEFDAACTFVMVEKAPEVPEDTETETVKIAFDNKAKRTSFSTEQQVWEENGITVTNDKAGSSSNVADYANPVRFYKSSKLTVEYTGMTKLEFACGESKYATALKSSINVAGATVTVSGSVVTVELSAAADSFVIASLTGGQVRVSSITVTTG